MTKFVATFLLCVAPSESLSLTTTTYNYFAYGSNMALSTMTDLRNIQPLSYSPAILPNHELVFNLPGIPFVEPSWASVEPTSTSTSISTSKSKSNDYENTNFVHGVLYQLSEQDFQQICQTEGVPFAYRLHRCEPIPYVGDGKNAGRMAWEQHCQAIESTSSSFISSSACDTSVDASGGDS